MDEGFKFQKRVISTEPFQMVVGRGRSRRPSANKERKKKNHPSSSNNVVVFAFSLLFYVVTNGDTVKFCWILNRPSLWTFLFVRAGGGGAPGAIWAVSLRTLRVVVFRTQCIHKVKTPALSHVQHASSTSWFHRNHPRDMRTMQERRAFRGAACSRDSENSLES